MWDYHSCIDRLYPPVYIVLLDRVLIFEENTRSLAGTSPLDAFSAAIKTLERIYCRCTIPYSILWNGGVLNRLRVKPPHTQARGCYLILGYSILSALLYINIWNRIRYMKNTVQ